MRKSPDYMYWTFFHNTSRSQVNVSSAVFKKIEKGMNAVGAVDYKMVKSALSDAYKEIVNLLDSNFMLAFSKSKHLEEFALSRTKLSVRYLASTLGVTESRWKTALKTTILDFVYGNRKNAEKRIAALIKAEHGKRPKRSALAKLVKEIDKKL